MQRRKTTPQKCGDTTKKTKFQAGGYAIREDNLTRVSHNQ